MLLQFTFTQPLLVFRFLDEPTHVTTGSNGSSMMNNPGSNNGGSGSSWLFSGPGSGSGFQPTDPLGGPHGGHLPPPHTTSSTFTPTSAYEDSRSGQHTPMLPFSQTDLSFVDTLTIHPSQQQKTQQQQQSQQHFVTSSTLHPGSTLSVVEAASEATTGT